jgi:Tol biopolymer transport system component
MTRLAACTFGIILPLLLIVTFGAVEVGKTRALEVLLFQRFEASQARTYMWDFHSRLLLPSPQYRILYSTPSPSPDGRWLVYSSYRGGQSDILLRDFTTETVSRLTFSLSDDHSPVWSRDGRWVAFTSNRDGNYEVYLVEVLEDGLPGEYIRVTDHASADLSPVWLE